MAACQAAISSTEFAEWIAYAQLEPFGSLREDQRSGTIAATVANVHRKRSSRAYTYRDFLPAYKPRKDWHEILEAVVSINTALGGTDRRKKRDNQ